MKMKVTERKLLVSGFISFFFFSRKSSLTQLRYWILKIKQGSETTQLSLVKIK